METEILNELKNMDVKNFIVFYKHEDEWVYFFSDSLLLINTERHKKNDVIYSNKYFNYELGNKLYNIISESNFYTALFYLASNEKCCGYIYSKKFMSINDIRKDAFNKLYKIIIEKEINLEYEDFNSLSNVIQNLKDIIIKNKLNVDFKIFLTHENDVLEERYKDIVSYIKTNCYIN